MTVKTGSQSLVVRVSYCPELGIYHYTRSTGEEFFFDEAKLHTTLKFYLEQGNREEARLIILLTADAKENPHKIVVYVDGNPPSVVDPVPFRAPPEQGVPSGGA
jgi:hypothetical protein